MHRPYFSDPAGFLPSSLHEIISRFYVTIGFLGALDFICYTFFLYSNVLCYLIMGVLDTYMIPFGFGFVLGIYGFVVG